MVPDRQLAASPSGTWLLAALSLGVCALGFRAPFLTGGTADPLFVFACLRPLAMLASDERLPPVGPPHWLRRYLFWIGREMRAHAPQLLLLFLATLGQWIWIERGLMLDGLQIRKILTSEWAGRIPLGIALFGANLGYVFILRSYPMRKLETLARLGTAGLGWAAACYAFGIAGNPALGVFWGEVTFAITWTAVLEARASRGLPPCGLRGVLAEAGTALECLDRSRESPVLRLLRRGRWLILLGPTVLMAGVIAFAWQCLPAKTSYNGWGFRAPFSEFTFAVTGGLGVLLGLTWLRAMMAQAGAFRRLRDGAMLSQVRLTPVSVGEILAVIWIASWRRVGIGLAAAALIFGSAEYFRGGDRLSLAAIVVIALAAMAAYLVVAILAFVDQMALLVRSAGGRAPVLLALARGVLFELALIAAGFMMCATVSRGSLSYGLLIMVHVVVLPASAYISLLRVLSEFDDVAHGNNLPPTLRASKDEVARFRALIAGGLPAANLDSAPQRE